MTSYRSVKNSVEKSSKEAIAKYLALKDAIQNQNRYIVYRGEEYDMVSKVLNIRFHGEYLKDLHEKIFMLGVKAKFYGTDKNIENFIFTKSESVTNGTFIGALNLLKGCFNADSKLSTSQRQAVLNFHKDNEKFVDWLMKVNIEKFCNLSIPTDVNLRISLRDYFFYFLHTISAADYKSRSVLLSTSKERDEAFKFISRNGGLIFEYLIPKPEKKYAVSHRGSDEIKDYFDKNKIPKITSSFYPSQLEYSIKRALFPQFILSIYDQKKDIFILNPKFESDQGIESILEDGFDIDQRRFQEVFESTNQVYYGVVRNHVFEDEQSFNLELDKDEIS